MENYGEILIYQSDDGLTNVEVKIQDETVWLTQQQIVYGNIKIPQHGNIKFPQWN